jgi:hypothetical protein
VCEVEPRSLSKSPEINDQSQCVDRVAEARRARVALIHRQISRTSRYYLAHCAGDDGEGVAEVAQGGMLRQWPITIFVRVAICSAAVNNISMISSMNRPYCDIFGIIRPLSAFA